MIENGDLLQNVASSAMSIAEILPLSEWAARYRYLSGKGSSEPGKWNNNRTPFLIEIMDSLNHPSVREVVFMKGAQVGGTELGLNWLGSIIHMNPAPTLMVQPNAEMAKRVSIQRIAPLLEDNEAIRHLVFENSEGKKNINQQVIKDFPGGFLVIASSKSTSGLRSMPIKNLFLDELDAFENDPREGDIVELASARTRTFSDRKIYKVSTPTVEGSSAISSEYENSDKRLYFVPCPHCRHEQALVWEQLKWQSGNPDSAYYECLECHGEIYENHKTLMLLNGRWIAQNPSHSESNMIVGYHLNSLYSPIGWFSWADAVRQWEKINGSEERMKSFLNTVLGITWKPKASEIPTWEVIYNRRESYPVGIIPSKKVCILTCGIDVQKDRIEIEVVGWCQNLESYSIEYKILEGDIQQTSVWNDLTRFIQKRYSYADHKFASLNISKVAIDCNFETNVVTRWVRHQSAIQVMAIRGRDEQDIILQAPRSIDFHSSGEKARFGVKIWNVGVSILKSELYGWLDQNERIDTDIMENGYPFGWCHFPEYSDEYFKQLISEQLVLVSGRSGQKSKYQWEKLRRRNEALDARLYARAALYSVGSDQWTATDWNDLAESAGLNRLTQVEEDKGDYDESYSFVDKETQEIFGRFL